MPGKIRWGFFGSGTQAGRFITGLKLLPDAEVSAVWSLKKEWVEPFAQEHGIRKQYIDVNAFLADPNIDIVYVCSPHAFHMEHTLMALEAGKHVLCEKPFAINALQARIMTDKARKKKLFLMEGVWTYFFPIMKRFFELLEQNAIGRIHMLSADFGFQTKKDPKIRLFNLEYGGGALMDVGIYPVSVARRVLGAPAEIKATAEIGDTGVDEKNAMVYQSTSGQLGLLHSAINVWTPSEVMVMGTKGTIRIHTNWWSPSKMTLRPKKGDKQVFEEPYDSLGYQFEQQHVINCLRQAKSESDAVPLSETIEVMAILDTIRAQWGLEYPMEKETAQPVIE